MIYIDGDHSFKSVDLDISYAKKLVKDGGIICGDDLELELKETDIENTKRNSDKDYIKDPKTNKFFHPGVTLAVAKHFDKVSNYLGFWAVKKEKNNFVPLKLEIDLSNLILPPHLTSMKDYIIGELNRTMLKS